MKHPAVFKTTQSGKGLGVEACTPEEAEAAWSVLCINEGEGAFLFPDNVHTTCAACGCGIEHRPDAPKKPPKLCVPCGLLLGQEMGMQ